MEKPLGGSPIDPNLPPLTIHAPKTPTPSTSSKAPSEESTNVTKSIFTGEDISPEAREKYIESLKKASVTKYEELKPPTSKEQLPTAAFQAVTGNVQKGMMNEHTLDLFLATNKASSQIAMNYLDSLGQDELENLAKAASEAGKPDLLKVIKDRYGITTLQLYHDIDNFILNLKKQLVDISTVEQLIFDQSISQENREQIAMHQIKGKMMYGDYPLKVLDICMQGELSQDSANNLLNLANDQFIDRMRRYFEENAPLTASLNQFLEHEKEEDSAATAILPLLFKYPIINNLEDVKKGGAGTPKEYVENLFNREKDYIVRTKQMRINTELSETSDDEISP